MNEGLPVGVIIRDVVHETQSVRTFILDWKVQFVPGQFVMVWVPGVDEVPMALTGAGTITVQRVGDATDALFGLGPGDLIGVRGPFGNGFSTGARTLAVAGGIGVAPLLSLARGGGVQVFLLGARTTDELLFVEDLRQVTKVVIATDDGSSGHHGYVAELMDTLDLTLFDGICTCGPEPMMAAVLTRLCAHGMEGRGQFSLHRYMKCGVGVCGSCAIDPSGMRVCREGPVFTGDQLIGSEFGQYHRDAAGVRI
ncbi:MAG: dihydroorotate dehydrogenase electron transfer subunit [Methanomicrobiales archaeon]|nr:dihydroorotate dehydrogenase electron transfer subunit [Methanomicrobiales archaeon]